MKTPLSERDLEYRHGDSTARGRIELLALERDILLASRGNGAIVVPVVTG